jgi:hypothetical protein
MEEIPLDEPESMPNIEIPKQKIKEMPIEFDFSNHREDVRGHYLKSIGFDEAAIKKMFQKNPSGYLREEGIDEKEIQANIKKKYEIYIDFDKMIEDFKNEEKDAPQDPAQLMTSFEKYEISEEKLKKSLLKKKKQQIRRVNQKS